MFASVSPLRVYSYYGVCSDDPTSATFFVIVIMKLRQYAVNTLTSVNMQKLNYLFSYAFVDGSLESRTTCWKGGYWDDC